MMTYSVIIPHKNSPKELKRLITTIPERNDLQVIVVDDNSDLSVVNWDELLLLKHSNLEFVRTYEGKGAGYARNVGVKKASGKWLLFADADDLFTKEISVVLDKYKEDKDTDIVYLNADRVNENGERWPFVSKFYIDNYNKQKFYSEKILRYGMWSPWTRMVKRNLVLDNSICFEEIPTGNDMMFSLNCSKLAKAIAAESVVVYLYYVPQNRSQTEEFRRKLTNIKYRIELGQRQNNLYKSVGYIFKDTNISAYRNPPSGSNKREYQIEYRKQLKSHNVCMLLESINYLIYKLGFFLNILKK